VLSLALLLGCRTSPLGGAKLDEKRAKRLRQTVLSSQIGLFYPSAQGSEVPSSKVAFFRAVQNFQTIHLL